MVLGLSLAACAQSGFVDEGAETPDPGEGNGAKTLLIAMGAIDDPRADTNKLRFQPRPPLVLPPQRTLPTPIDRDAALAAKGFPVDPEVRAEQERLARLKQSGGSGNGALTMEEQAKFKDLPTAPSEGRYVNPHPERPLSPMELEAEAKLWTQAENASDTRGAAAKKQDSLITPPVDYRTPSDKAPIESPPQGLASMKPSWWPF
jgi:hypothetical protein